MIENQTIHCETASVGRYIMTASNHLDTNVEPNLTKVKGDTAAPYAHIVQSQQQEQSSLPLANRAASNAPEQGFLTMTSPFEAASNQPHSGFLNSVESSAGHLLTSAESSGSQFMNSAESSGSEFLHDQGDMWSRVADGQGSVKDDAMAALEFTAGASLAIAGGAALAGVIGAVGLDGIGSMGILGYSPLTAGLVPPPLFVMPMSML
jgi:hypothetical protein